MMELVVRKSAKDVDKLPDTCRECSHLYYADACSIKYPAKLTVDPSVERDSDCPLRVIPVLLITDNPEAEESEFVVVCSFEDTKELATLCDQLRNHDWTFEMSDDHRYWRKGTEEVASIKRLISKYGDNGIKIFKYFYPENNAGCHSFNSYIGRSS